MGMRLKLVRVSSRDIALVKSGAETAAGFIEANTPVRNQNPDYLRAREEMRVQMGLPAPPPPGTFESYPFQDVFDVDKMWNGLYFLLTGTEDAGEGPATWLLHSPPVSNEMLGYTPAMEISPEHTQQLSHWLDRFDRAEVLDRFDGPKMQDLQIYPDVWDEDPDELKDELGHAFDQLRAYCRKCADHGFGMLSYIS